MAQHLSRMALIREGPTTTTIFKNAVPGFFETFARLFGVFLKTRVRKSSLNIKFLGGIFLGHPGPRRRDIPDKKLYASGLFCCFRHGVAGMSRDLGRDVPDLEKLYARKLWADFSHAIPLVRRNHPKNGKKKGFKSSG